MYRTDIFTPSRFLSNGSINLRGVNIPYHTVCEDNVFYNEDGKPIASIFTYSYFRSDVENSDKRPILFCFNGGPGSSSMMVHAGFLGPIRLKYAANPDNFVALPPYEVIGNPQCMLDEADLVIIDPVATGFGLLLDGNYADKFFGIEEDAESLLCLIEHWLSQYKRWNSPKYLLGESYGCTRASVAAGLAQGGNGADRAYGIVFDGLILIGNTVSTGRHATGMLKTKGGFPDWPTKSFNMGVPVEPSVEGFPTYAAVNWYHNHPCDQSLEDFVFDAKNFADTDYLLALYQGDNLSNEERERISKMVMYYTGVSREYLEQNDLRLNEVTIRSQFLRGMKRHVSRLDGRITRSFYHTGFSEHEAWGPTDDAADAKYSPCFHAAVCGPIFSKLNIELKRPFVPTFKFNMSNRWNSWNKEMKKGTTAEQLSSAMLRVPSMRTFFANGLYDLCTPIGIAYYTISHAGLPKDRTFIKAYPSGHMIYIGEENIRMLSDDILKFIKGENPA